MCVYSSFFTAWISGVPETLYRLKREQGTIARYVFCYTKGQKIGQRITESGFNKAWRKARTAAGCRSP